MAADSHPAIQYRLNHPGESDLAAVLEVRFEDEAAYAYHRSLPEYAPTPLIDLPGLAGELGLAALWVKDESARFGLNAFKVLGASYAVHRWMGGRPGPFTFCTATDGNHGRAVAWSARRHGQAAVVFMPRGSAPARVRAIEGEGARVIVVAGDYDEAIRCARRAAHENGWTLVQDSAWDGYTAIPAWIMAGYATMLRELERSALPAAAPAVDLVFVQAGVGSWAAAAVWYLCRRYGRARPKVACVEPLEAACCLESAEAGRRTTAHGSGRTIMAGLNCGTPSSLAWPILQHGADAFLAVPDDYARRAMRQLYRPAPGDRRIVAGESGAAGLAGLLAILSEPGLAALREHLGLGPASRVLVVNTEGATDPDGFRAICGADGVT